MKTFKITSNKICISDPAYERGTWCGNYDLPAQNGEWTAKVKYKDEGEWGNRVASLLCQLKGGKGGKWEPLPNEVGVDSGQAGVFCSSIYPKNEDERGDYGDLNSFYGKACEATMGEGYEETQICWKVKNDIKSKVYAFIGKEKNLEITGEVYGKDSKQYRFLRDEITEPEIPWEQFGIVANAGVCSSSGFGDGSYSGLVKKNDKGEIVAVKIKFI